MGKKRLRSKRTSKGQRPSIAKWVSKAVKRDRSPIDNALNVLDAWMAGKNPWITIHGTESNKPFEKVRANKLKGNPKDAYYSIYGKVKQS